MKRGLQAAVDRLEDQPVHRPTGNFHQNVKAEAWRVPAELQANMRNRRSGAHGVVPINAVPKCKDLAPGSDGGNLVVVVVQCNAWPCLASHPASDGQMRNLSPNEP